MDLMSAILERDNLFRALKRVKTNRGAPGVDGVTVEALAPYLKVHWPEIKEQLLAGEYRPQAVRQVEIPKASGALRALGIPTALDRLIQQAMHQVLSPLFEPTFSDHSYGFRPRRSAGQAVQQAREHVESGHRWVVDMDLAEFFDRVNHDILMSRVAREVKDRRVLKLIRSFLSAGVMVGGMIQPRQEGTPQGGPLSPLLSNILLTDLDRELERRGHRFCRYADDCNIYVKSERAGERVLDSISGFLHDKLRLAVNVEKSAVDRPWKRQFLGYSVCNRRRHVRLKVSKQSIVKLKASLKQEFRRGRGQSLRRLAGRLRVRLRGWLGYFRYAGVKGVFEELDGWIRRHLRKILWRQWKRPHTRAKRLMGSGIAQARAWCSATNGRGPWWNAGASHMNQALPKKFFDHLGCLSLMDEYYRLKRVS